MKLKVYRYDKNTKISRYDDFEIPQKTGQTVLDALFYVQDELDDSLIVGRFCVVNIAICVGAKEKY